MEPAPASEKTAGISTTAEEIYASGILKKPSLRLPSRWKAESTAASAAGGLLAPAAAIPAGADSFGTFRPGSRLTPSSSNLSHRPSIILEEVPMMLPPAEGVKADTEC